MGKSEPGKAGALIELLSKGEDNELLVSYPFLMETKDDMYYHY
jgi:hypothetical protein